MLADKAIDRSVLWFTEACRVWCKVGIEYAFMHPDTVYKVQTGFAGAGVLKKDLRSLFAGALGAGRLLMPALVLCI